MLVLLKAVHAYKFILTVTILSLLVSAPFWTVSIVISPGF